MTQEIMMLRNSERSTWKKCRHRWQWTYLDGRQDANAPHALRFGDLVHRALERYYLAGTKRGQHPAEAFSELYHERAKELEDGGFDIWSDERWVSALDLGTGMLEGYVKRYADDDARYEVLSSEQTFQLLARHPDQRLNKRPFRFRVVGTFDGVWKDLNNGQVVFKEFKTAASIQLDALAMDEQAGTYWAFGPEFLQKIGMLQDDEDLTSILYTFLRKAVPNPDATRNEKGHKLNLPKKDALLDYLREQSIEEFNSVPIGKLKVDDLMEIIGRDKALQLGEVSKVQDAPYFERVPVYRDAEERVRMRRRVADEALEIAKARLGRVPLYKNPGPLHMPNCRGCSVREACEIHEAGGDFESILSGTMKPWNPYAAHELAERQ